jgi:predicted nucleotidyltransferase
MSVHPDFKDILRIFNDCQVEYLIVGGYAVALHAEPRYTKDLDLWVRASQENAQAVFKALRTFGAPLTDLTADDFAREGYFYQIGVPPVRVDILMSIKGVQFQDAWARRVEVDFDGVKALFISKEDLIVAKLAAGRPQDIADAQTLALSELPKPPSE